MAFNGVSFIAGQYPIPHAFESTWKMVIEQSIGSIIILTKEVDSGQRKGDVYWPRELNQVILYGSVRVRLVNVHAHTYFIQYDLSVQGHHVILYEYQDWPDKQPANSRHLLEFIHHYHSKIKSQGVFVHCSAGIGRTGTFLVIDTVMRMKVRKGEPADLVVAVLKEYKKQRVLSLSMDQFRMVYETLWLYYRSL